MSEKERTRQDGTSDEIFHNETVLCGMVSLCRAAPTLSTGIVPDSMVSTESDNIFMNETAEITSLGKREKRQIERHNAILDVAERCFLENGYAGTSMSAISAALGGSKGTLWSYFSSKEELFAAVVDRKAEVFRDVLSSALEQDVDLRSALELFCERFIRKISSAEGIAVYRIVAGESGRSPEVGRIFYERGPGCNERIMADFLDAHIQRGNLRRLSEPEEMAGFLKSMCTGSRHMRMVLGIDPPGAPADAGIVAKRVVDVFLAAYGTER